MKAAVLGVGRMGEAICWAMNKLGFEIVGIDSNEQAISRFRSRMESRAKETKSIDMQLISDGKRTTFAPANCSEGVLYITNDDKGAKSLTWDSILLEEKPDVVISSLPYHQTEELADWCIHNGVRYCDLGGRVDVSKHINDYAKERASKPVFTDLGLAPGWVNILAEEGCKRLHSPAEDVKMMVGGLPDYLESSTNPLRYAVTWSVDGLINEYRDDCLILEDGEIKTVKGMDGLVPVDGENFGKMEAFYTSGGASHSIYSMKKRGVKNCSYRTLRYHGHRDIVKFLIRDCGLDDKALNQIFLEGCGVAARDEVFIVAEVSGGDKVWRKDKIIKSDEAFSAMQKATAFPISCVASLMAEGALEGDKDEHRDYWTQYPAVLSYADIPFEEYNNRLEKLGI